MHEKSANRDDNEIDLLDIIKQLWRGKVLILSTSIILTLIAGIYLALAPPKWTAESTLSRPYLNQLANYPTGVMLSQLWATASPVTGGGSNYVVDDAKITKNVFDIFISIINEHIAAGGKISIRPGNSAETFILSTSAESAEQAKQDLQSILKGLNEDSQKRLYSMTYSILHEREQSLKLQIQTQESNAQVQKSYRETQLKNALQIAKQMDIQQNKINRASGEISDEMLFMLGAPALTAIIEHENNMPLKFDANYYYSKEILNSINTFRLNDDGFYAFNGNKVLTVRTGQKRWMIIVFSFLLGLLASSGYILLSHALRNVKQ